MQGIIAAIYAGAIYVVDAACCIIVLAVLIALATGYVNHRVSKAVERERRRFTAYLRRQAQMAASVSNCARLGSRGRDQEAYLAVVLEETALEVDALAHYADVQK